MNSQCDLATIDVLLVNPAAGGGRALQAVPRLRLFAQERGWPLEICMTESAEDLADKARRAAQRGHRRLFVLGGDGTFQVLLNAVCDYPEIVLGLVPAGGGNDLAAALGLPEDPVQVAATLLDGEVCRMDAVRVRTADGNERLYTGGGGVGLDAEAAQYASGAYRNLHGRFRYLLSAIRALLGFQLVSARISSEGQESLNLELRALVVGVLNTPSYGAGLYLAPDAKTDDGCLDLVVLQDLTMLQIVSLLPSLWSRGRLKTNRVQRFRGTQFRIETEDSRCFHGDGEILGKTPVEISVVPGAFRMMRGRQKTAS